MREGEESGKEKNQIVNIEENLKKLLKKNKIKMLNNWLVIVFLFDVCIRVGGASLIEYFAHHENLSDPLCALSVEQAFQGLLHLHQLGIGHFSIRVS